MVTQEDTVEEQIAVSDPAELRAEREKFWKDATIPVNENWKDDQTNFANPVDVADMFARATGIAAMLATEAEELTEAIANAEYLKDDAQIVYSRLRRQIIANNFSSLKSSWNSETLDAFIVASAGDKLPALEAAEKLVETTTREIRVRKPRLEKLKTRLKRLETSMEWAKEWLNYDKLMHRITEQVRR